MRRRWRELYKLARRQHGVIQVAQALALGISDSALHERAAAEEWIQLQRGVYLLPAAVRTFRSDVAAALLAVGDPVLATGATALYLHGVIDERPPALQLAVPADRKKPAVVGVDDVVRSRTIIASDRVEIDGLSTAVVALALLHFGRRERQRAVLEVVVNALQRDKVELSEISAVLQRCGRAPGRAGLRGAHEAMTIDQVDSLLELDTRQLARSANFTPHPSPFPFRCPDSRVIHLDVPFPSIWFAWECDSPKSRSGGRSFNTDRTRWTQARRGGWQLGWVTRERLRSDRAGLLEELAEAHAQADPERPPPVPTPCRRKACDVCAPLREG